MPLPLLLPLPLPLPLLLLVLVCRDEDDLLDTNTEEEGEEVEAEIKVLSNIFRASLDRQRDVDDRIRVRQRDTHSAHATSVLTASSCIKKKHIILKK